MRYSLRTLVEVITVAAFVLALVICWRAGPAPAPLPPPSPLPGRYQLFMADGGTMVLDTSTGKLWSRPKGYAQFSGVIAPWTKEP